MHCSNHQRTRDMLTGTISMTPSRAYMYCSNHQRTRDMLTGTISIAPSLGNHTGSDNAARAALEARYGMVTFGWETDVCATARPSSPQRACTYAGTEAALDAAAARLYVQMRTLSTQYQTH